MRARDDGGDTLLLPIRIKEGPEAPQSHGTDSAVEQGCAGSMDAWFQERFVARLVERAEALRTQSA